LQRKGERDFLCDQGAKRESCTGEVMSEMSRAEIVAGCPTGTVEHIKRNKSIC